MQSLSDRFLTAALVALAALVLAATAAAQPTGVNESLAQYGWGAAATYAKQQTLGGKPATLAADDLSQYGWGAAATYAKQQAAAGKQTTLAGNDLSAYGWGAAATYAKQQASSQPSARTITAGELMAMDKGYPTYRAKMNEYDGVGSSSASVRRPTPGPSGTGVTAPSGSGNDVAWGDVTAGALGGFGIALLVGIGGFVLISHRRTGTLAH